MSEFVAHDGLFAIIAIVSLLIDKEVAINLPKRPSLHRSDMGNRATRMDYKTLVKTVTATAIILHGPGGNSSGSSARHGPLQDDRQKDIRPGGDMLR